MLVTRPPLAADVGTGIGAFPGRDKTENSLASADLFYYTVLSTGIRVMHHMEPRSGGSV